MGLTGACFYKQCVCGLISSCSLAGVWRAIGIRTCKGWRNGLNNEKYSTNYIPILSLAVSHINDVFPQLVFSQKLIY